MTTNQLLNHMAMWELKKATDGYIFQELALPKDQYEKLYGKVITLLNFLFGDLPQTPKVERIGWHFSNEDRKKYRKAEYEKYRLVSAEVANDLYMCTYLVCYILMMDHLGGREEIKNLKVEVNDMLESIIRAPLRYTYEKNPVPSKKSSPVKKNPSRRDMLQEKYQKLLKHESSLIHKIVVKKLNDAPKTSDCVMMLAYCEKIIKRKTIARLAVDKSLRLIVKNYNQVQHLFVQTINAMTDEYSEHPLGTEYLLTDISTAEFELIKYLYELRLKYLNSKIDISKKNHHQNIDILSITEKQKLGKLLMGVYKEQVLHKYIRTANEEDHLAKFHSMIAELTDHPYHPIQQLNYMLHVCQNTNFSDDCRNDEIYSNMLYHIGNAYKSCIKLEEKYEKPKNESRYIKDIGLILTERIIEEEANKIKSKKKNRKKRPQKHHKKTL